MNHQDNVQWVAVGKVARAHGIRGELRIKLFNAESEVLFDVDQVLLTKQGQADQILEVRAARAAALGIVLLSFEGIFDRTSAELLRGAFVHVDRRDLGETQQGEFFIHDIINARVVDESAGELGRVVDYVSYPTADVLVVQGENRYEIPMIEDFVQRVDTEHKLVMVQQVDEFIVT